MARILFFDGYGYLYFKEKENLNYMRDGLVKTVNEKLNLDFPDDTELVLCSLKDQSTPYKWSSFNDFQVENNWIEGIESLFLDNDLVLCEYDWLNAAGKYSNAREQIISAVLHSDKIVYFILYSSVKASEANAYYADIRNHSYTDNIHLAREAVTFNEDYESMHYTLTRKMEKFF